MPPKLFISYRRLDSQDFTDRLYEHMVRHFGEDHVFQDVGDSSAIPPGVDFVEYLAAQVQACDVVLVVIGEQWMRILTERRDRDDDFVRIEVESALKQGKLVIPVLKSNTPMPTSADLPESIRPLARRSASRIRPNPDFRRDCDTLAEGIKKVTGGISTPPPPSTRKPSTTELLVPPFAWIEIPGGHGTMKTSDENVTLTIPTERYWIAKYPVTNAQFAQFMQAGGYTTDRWWTPDGLAARRANNWTQPRFWDNSDLNGAEHPVVGVSWYETVAFFLWLTNVTGESVMLPTEAQWQYAAQGNDGHTYPWGNKFDAKRCNSAHSKIGKTTPVTQYIGKDKGDSPFGVSDMSGNVWEWCLTAYESGKNDLSGTGVRVLRGGSWSNDYSGSFRCDYRSRTNPVSRYSLSGFRCARS